MNTRLLLVRHGQTAWNLEARFMGQADIPLDETGQGQALAVAARLAPERPAVIYSSDLRRARETALAIQSSLAAGVELVTDARLREMHFGDWQGRTYSEIKEQDPQALISWEANGLEVAPPHGETLLLFGERVNAAYRDICSAQPDQSVIVVGHGGTLQLLIVQALGVPLETFWRLRLSNASLSELRVQDAGAILYLLNDTSHLSGRG